MWSEDAEQLVLGTAAVESRLKFIRQVGGGPALGLWQIEPDTYDDYWDSYLKYRPTIAETVLTALGYPEKPPAERLISDLMLGAIMCRIHYRRKKPALPNYADVWSQAAYWKEHYNTIHGAGTQQKYVDACRLVN